jgi:hypothetical protein
VLFRQRRLLVTQKTKAIKPNGSELTPFGHCNVVSRMRSNGCFSWPAAEDRTNR